MSTAWDLGIYEQVLWSTANTGRLFWYTPEILINPSCSFFGIHFSPILFLVLPIYWIFQSTETLLILQVFILALAAVPLYKFVFHESNSSKQALIFSLIYLAYPPIYGMILFDFHVQAFLPLLFFLTFYHFKKQEWGKYFLSMILSLMVIEFVPLIVVFFGLYGIWANRKDIRLLRTFDLDGFFSNKAMLFSVVTIVLGLVWFAVARTVISATNPSAPPHPNWQDFGDPTHDLPGFILNVLANPVKVLKVIVTPVDQKALYVFGLFAPLAFLSFLDLPSLMIGAPWFFVAFLSNYPSYYNPVGYQYVAFVASFIFISAFHGARRFLAAKDRFGFKRRFSAVLKKVTVIPQWKGLLVVLLVLTIAVSYISAMSIRVNFPTITEHERLLDTFVGLIPSNAAILTQNNLFPHLSRRLYGYVGGGFSDPMLSSLGIEYIFIDTSTHSDERSLEAVVYDLIKDGELTTQSAADGIWLFSKDYAGEATYPVDRGVFVKFFNQGIRVKLFDSASASTPSYENVTLSIRADLGSGIPELWAEKTFFLVFEGWLYAPKSDDYLFQLQSLGLSSFAVDGAQVLCSNNSFNGKTMYLDKGFHPVEVNYTRDNAYFLPLVSLSWKPSWETSVQEIPSQFLQPTLTPEAFSVFLDASWEWGFRSPFVSMNQNRYSASANTTLHVPSSGTYRFRTVTDGDTCVLIDGEVVIDLLDGVGKTSAEVFLTEGKHDFHFQYLKVGGYSHLNVMWQLPGHSQFEGIPSEYLHWRGD
jgi:uncharacterized membrane protein